MGQLLPGSRPHHDLPNIPSLKSGGSGRLLGLIRPRWGDRCGSIALENIFVGNAACKYFRCLVNKLYRWWVNMIFMWSIYSTFFTPLEFGFFKGLPDHMSNLECVQFIFFADLVLQFLVAYRDPHTYKIVHNKKSIALRYAKGSFALDALSCIPWDIIYKTTGRRELMRCLIWLRLYRARNIKAFFQRLEKDIRVNYLFTRIVKLIMVELYCTHTAACIMYYLATTIPPEMEGYTWIGSLRMGSYNYDHFREIGFWRRYITSLYFAIVTMATVGYGDIHAVNNREMLFVMVFISFDMVLGAYLIGNMTALIVKGSKTERFRDRMTDLIKYMNRNRLGKDIRSQIKSHLRLQYESSYTKSSILNDIPVAVRSKVTRLNEEFFLPGEVILEQGTAVDQLYIVSHGRLEEVVVGEDGLEECVAVLEPHNVFGEVAILCSIPQPYTVRVCELCRLLRLEKQSLTSILRLYFVDSRQILSNLLKGKDTDSRIKQLESDIVYLIAKQEAELVLGVNSAAYHGDLYHLKGLINAGANPCKADYDGRTALHLAASRGYEDIARFLIKRGANVNCIDKFGNSPLLEAISFGHDRVSKLLIENGAILSLDDPGSYLCKVVKESKIDVLRRFLQNGVDPNCKNYDLRTPLHVAAAEGLHIVAKILIEFGADVLSEDRNDK
ncbi:Potassium channel KOR2 [Acorus calamus]|uniref:Potassium channel n=1 Tax=Acorus calamus TaxID=4465 RepID=A0AAV9DHS4_ACOCL|nr:Potassium channel KOR2 [Acorus calamus]